MAPLHPPTNSAASALPSTAPYSLHVCNIPTDMGKAGLKNLFAKYGEVTEIFLSEWKERVLAYYFPDLRRCPSPGEFPP